jgi:electron transfer flavoprotein beta subunit
MKIMTLIRQVPDVEARLRTAGCRVELGDATLVIDGMDEYGVEAALELKEGTRGEEAAGAEVVVVAVGPKRNEEALRTALAMGADRALHVETDEVLDPIALSQVVAELVRREGATLLLLGAQQADWDSQALGAATAERLGWPQLTWTNALTVQGGVLSGRHDVDEGSDAFSVALPAVVTTQQGLNEPRYPTLPNIMKAKRKELRKESLEAFGVRPLLTRVAAEVQTKERLGRVVDGKDAAAAAAQLVRFLREEAKVGR